MSTPLAISCPHCGAGLKLKSHGFVGKKVPCPKCKQPFLVEEPPEDEFLSQDDDFGAMDEPEDEPEPPRSKGKSKGGKGKKKSKSGGGAAIAMIGGGVVLGLGLLAGIVYGAMTFLSGGGSNSWVKWLPDDIDVAIQVRMADSINAPIFKPITDNPTLAKLMNQPPLPGNGANPAAAFFQGLNIQAKDVDTLTVGLVNGISLMDRTGVQPPQTPQQFVAVVRLKTAVDESKLAQAPPTVLAKEDYNSKVLYAVVGSANPRVLVHAVDATTFLVGSDAELKAAIDGQGSAPASKRFAFADDKSSFLFVAAPKDESKLKALGISTLQVSSSGGTTDTGAVEGIHGVSYGCTLGSDLIVNIRTSLSRSMAQPSADQMKKEMEALRPQIQAQMAQVGGFNPFMSNELLKKVLGHVDTMLGTAQATASGSTANLTMTLSGQIVADGVLMAAPAMPMLEALVQKQQAAAAASSAPTGASSGFGSSPMDITAYPGAVINAGEKSKGRIGQLGDQHNADIEAQMQEGGASAPAAGGAQNAGQANRGGNEAAMRLQMQGASGGPPPGQANRGGNEAAMRLQMQGASGGPPPGEANRGGNEAAMRLQMQGAGGGPPPGEANRGGNEEAMRLQMQGAAGGPPAGEANRGGNEAAMRQRMQGAGAPGGPEAGPAGAEGQNGEQPKQPASRSRSRRKPSK